MRVTGYINIVLSLLQSKLFLDAFDRTRLKVGVVHRQNRMLTVQVHLQVQAFASLKGRSLLG